MPKPNTQELFFIRQEGMVGVTQILVIQLEWLEGALEKFETKTPLDLLRLAITNWVMKTEAGQEAWSVSVQDFNIGDLLSHLGDADLQNEMRLHWVSLKVLAQMCESENVAYDQVLPLAHMIGDED